MTRSNENLKACLPRVLVRAVFTAFFLLASGCAKQQAAPTARPPASVTVGKVTQKTMPVEVVAVGNVEAISTVSIRAQVAGEVQLVHFKEGDFVTKGQVLFTIDPRPFEAALAQAKAALARDKATDVYDRAQAKRYKTLFDQGVIPAEQVDSFTSAADAQDALVNSDEAAVKTAELNLEYCTITSPIDGHGKGRQSGEGCGRSDRDDQSGESDLCEFWSPAAVLAGYQRACGSGRAPRQSYDSQGCGFGGGRHHDLRGQRRGFHDRNDSFARHI
jgi:multidrug efflux pump subunit AcrA (membrane-fusion protein)